MKILDLSAGNRAIWFDKNYRDTVFVDHRESVNPTIVADTRHLPDCVGSNYDLIVFDPPHVNFGKNSKMSKTYGHSTTSEIQDLLKETAKEAHRISATGAFMAFKWNDHDQSFKSVLSLIDGWWEPLFSHKVASRTKHSSSTQWVLLRRRDEVK